MKTFDDPFDYPEPFKPPKTEEQIDELKEKRRAYRAKKLGRPLGNHGGSRKGSGRKRTSPWTHRIYLDLDRIQVKLLEDLGNGDVNNGVQALVEKHCG